MGSPSYPNLTGSCTASFSTVNIPIPNTLHLLLRIISRLMSTTTTQNELSTVLGSHVFVCDCFRKLLIRKYVKWLVTDKIVHKITSKHHKIDEKAPILWCMFIHQYLIFENSYPTTHIILKKISGPVLKTPTLTEKRAPPFCQFFWFCSNPKKYLSLCRGLIFILILVYTQVILIRNQYIIIYTTNKRHFTWMSIFHCLIFLLSFLIQSQYNRI